MVRDGAVVGHEAPPVWPTERSIVLGGDDPRVLDLDAGAVELVAPPANSFVVVAAAGRRFAAFHREGNLVWGERMHQ